MGALDIEVDHSAVSCECTQDCDCGGDGGESLNYKYNNDKTPGTLVLYSVVLVHLTTGWQHFSKYKAIWLLYSQVTTSAFIILHL